MQMAFPVLVHGMTKQVATTGSMRPDDDREDPDGRARGARRSGGRS